MRKIDAYLSRKAQMVWPTAIIWKEETLSTALRPDVNSHGQVFILQREGTADVILGKQFRQVKDNLEELLERECSKRAGPESNRDEFLTLRAQEMWPTAVVYKEEPSSATLRLDGSGNSQHVFILQREGHGDIILGHKPGEAKAGLDALLASERSRRNGSAREGGEEVRKSV
jgi:hypothetical protein